MTYRTEPPLLPKSHLGMNLTTVEARQFEEILAPHMFGGLPVGP